MCPALASTIALEETMSWFILNPVSVGVVRHASGPMRSKRASTVALLT